MDRKVVLEAFEKYKKSLAKAVNILFDGDCRGCAFAEDVNEILGGSVQVAMRKELHTYIVMLQRWVLEQPFA